MFEITKKQLSFYLLYIAILTGIGTISGAFILRQWRIGAAIGLFYGTGYVAGPYSPPIVNLIGKLCQPSSGDCQPNAPS